MIKAVIIDDEPLARSIIREYLQHYSQITIVDECNDGFEGIKSINQHSPDIIFLDIQMPKINGFEMLELLDELPAVIFTTAYDEYAIKAFEVCAIDYLLKPFSKERFDKAIRKWLESHQNNIKNKTEELLESSSLSPMQHTRVVVKNGGKIKIIPVPNIQYLEAADDYVKVVTEEGSFLKNKTMQYFDQLLSTQNFVRIHRSYIVNTQLITRIDPYEKEGHLVILQTGMRLPASKTGYNKLKETLGL